MYRYHDPATVLSPQDCIDSVTTIYDGGVDNGAFAIAKVIWQGTPKIAIRWNITEREWNDPNKANGSTVCVGEPNSRGYATWFILPNDFILALLGGTGEIPTELRKVLAEIETQ
jgi:hypothetical protein